MKHEYESGPTYYNCAYCRVMIYHSEKLGALCKTCQAEYDIVFPPKAELIVDYIDEFGNIQYMPQSFNIAGCDWSTDSKRGKNLAFISEMNKKFRDKYITQDIVKRFMKELYSPDTKESRKMLWEVLTPEKVTMSCKFEEDYLNFDVSQSVGSYEQSRIHSVSVELKDLKWLRSIHDW